ncbi:SH3 domain-containing protein [Streptomyces sp. TRM66268-LWL]|uniref:SH3 domain-containing protein n=1 Tax=Streptomyces polyasparticus TaxID=2767826 RepID=A0ABR7SFW0_9ACTN|nr:SH3 domain-containing protein [Streptomyces polyasparticus]MBC9714382.1 SH3 domain-containing protein [Streptomyces polyasparticus]
MRTSPALRTLAVSVLAAAALTVPAAGPANAAAPAAVTAAPQWENGPIWGTVVSGSLNLRAEPNTWSAVVGKLGRGASDRIQCGVYGQNVNGNSSWFWLTGERAWASGAYMSTSRGVPDCGNWRPSSNNSGNWNSHHQNHRHDHNNPCRHDDWCDACRHEWR